jgi:hypothetical protein
MEDTVLPSAWWGAVSGFGPGPRLVSLYCMASADSRGVLSWSLSEVSKACGLLPEVVDATAAPLVRAGLLSPPWETVARFRWVPTLDATVQPDRGPLRREVDPSLPAPPVEVVAATLAIRLGRPPTEREVRAACPAAFGKGRAQEVVSGEGPIRDVFEAWRKRQAAPDACRLSPAVRSRVAAALREADADALVALIAFAYEADAPSARFWRGQNQTGATYLRLDQLLDPARLAGRVQEAIAWHDAASGAVSVVQPVLGFREAGEEVIAPRRWTR